MISILLHVTLILLSGTESPYYDCEVRYQQKDEKGKVIRTDLEEAEIFSYTDDKIRELMQDREYIEGHLSLSQSGKEYFAILRINIASPKAKAYYGVVEPTTPIRLSTIDRQSIFVKTVNRSEGKITSKGNTEYIIAARIEKSERKKLQKCEIDKIGFMWSTGYEEYEVYNVDLFKEQLSCLKKQK